MSILSVAVPRADRDSLVLAAKRHLEKKFAEAGSPAVNRDVNPDVDSTTDFWVGLMIQQLQFHGRPYVTHVEMSAAFLFPCLFGLVREGYAPVLRDFNPKALEHRVEIN